jgi:hypothetical protein
VLILSGFVHGCHDVSADVYRDFGFNAKRGRFFRKLAKLIGATDEPPELQAISSSGGAVMAGQVASAGWQF